MGQHRLSVELMGRGIAQLSAAAGYETVVREVNETLLDKGLGAVRAHLDRAVEKGKLESEARDATLGRLTPARLRERLDEVRERDEADDEETSGA